MLNDSKRSQTLWTVAKTSGCGCGCSRGTILYNTVHTVAQRDFSVQLLKPHQQPLYHWKWFLRLKWSHCMPSTGSLARDQRASVQRKWINRKAYTCVKNVNTMLAKSSKHVKLWPKLVSNRCKPVISFLLAGNRDEQLLPRVVNSSPKPFARSLRQLCRTANRVYNKFSICGTVCMRPVIVCTAVLLCMIEAL
jgi:hypothetical protein